MEKNSKLIKELSKLWPGYECSVSPTEAHWLVPHSTCEDGVIWECKYCHAFKWLPVPESAMMEMQRAFNTFGPVLGYAEVLLPRPGVVKKLQRLRLKASSAAALLRLAADL